MPSVSYPGLKMIPTGRGYVLLLQGTATRSGETVIPLRAFTGLEAKLDGDGRSFEEIALERAAQDGRPEPASRVWGPG